jgi:plasmid stabilization system protein ParE
MAERSVVWTETAIKRREILRYWTFRTKSTSYAEKLMSLIKDRVNFIAEHYEAGKSTTYYDTREAAMGNFSIYYKITESQIFIMAFWDNRQNPKKLLQLLNKK